MKLQFGRKLRVVPPTKDDAHKCNTHSCRGRDSRAFRLQTTDAGTAGKASQGSR